MMKMKKQKNRFLSWLLVICMMLGMLPMNAFAAVDDNDAKLSPDEAICEVTNIELDKTSVEMIIGESLILHAVISPEEATDKTVTWSSSDESVAAVDEQGTVTAVTVGTTMITAKAGEQEAICNVTVKAEEIEQEAIQIQEIDVESSEHTISMKLNEWKELNLAELLPEGASYSVSTDGEEWKPVNGTTYNYYPAGTGEQKVYFRALDAEGNPIKELTLIADVATPPSEVTVSLSITSGTMDLVECEATDKVMVPVEITVPYFDLGLYGLEDYYYNPQCYSTHKEGDTEYENNQLVGTKEMAKDIVTVMHAYIYATEIYYLGYDAAEAGTGASYESGEFEEVLSWTGNVGSSFMSFWDHGTNLNYYVDWTYPLGAPKWGSTSDQIALYGGEDITIHLIKDSSVQGSNFSYFTVDGTTNKASQVDVIHAAQGDEITLKAVKTQPDWEAYTTSYVPFETGIYWISEEELVGDMTEWSNTGLGAGSAGLKTDAEGNVTLDTSEMKPGTYYIGAAGHVDKNKGTETGAAVVKLELKRSPVRANPTVTVCGVETKAVNTGIIYNDAFVYFADLPFAGDLYFNDELHLVSNDLAGENRNFIAVKGNVDWGNQALPWALDIENPLYRRYVTTASEVEAKFGEIPGLGDENSEVWAFYVYDKYAGNMVGSNTLLYIIVTEGRILPSESITLDQTEMTIEGGKSFTLNPTILPANTTYNSITWTSSNNKVAEVSSDGVVTTYCAGTAVITAKLSDGNTASCEVTVTTNNPKPVTVYAISGLGGDWPESGYSIVNVTIGGVLVKNYVWYGTNCYVTLDAEYTPDDSIVSFSIKTDQCTATVNGREDNYNIPLVDGKATAAITGTVTDYRSQGERTQTKTIYISKTGDFDGAPQLFVSATDTVNRVPGEAYERNLSDVFRNYDDTEVSYTVTVDDKEPVSADENYRFVPEKVGTHKLVFKAENACGESGTYTVTIKVLDEKNTVKIGNTVEGKGTLHWIGITDGEGKDIEGFGLNFNAETKTVNVTLPNDYPYQGTVKTYMGMSRNADISGGSEYTGTLSNGVLKHNMSFCGQTYTINYQREASENYFELNIKDVPANGFESYQYRVDRILISGDGGKVETYQWNTSRVLNVLLDQDVTLDNQKFNTQFYGVGSMTGHGEVVLENGTAKQVVKNISSYGSFVGSQTFTVNFKKGTQPARMDGIGETVDATSPCLEAYETDLSKIFSDKDGDALTYQVKVNNGTWTAVDGDVHGFIPDAAKGYTLTYRAYDGFVYSDETYTIELAATNATTTYDVAVNNLPAGAEFYCNAGFNADGTDILGEKVKTETNADGAYTLKVPTNVSRIAITIGNARVTASVSADNETNIINIQKTTAKVHTLAGNPAEGTVSAAYGDGYAVVSEGNVFYLVSGDTYSFTAKPSEAYSAEWTNGKLENHTVTADAQAEVVVSLQVNKPKTITIDADADLKVFYQRGYYVMSEVDPVIVKENGDGTITYTYSCPKAQQYSMGNMYFATKEDYIDKAGYMMGKNDYIVTWEGDERKGDYRGEYDPNTTYGSRGDDSVLVNVNAQNHLILKEGETFRLRSSRIWEIINTDTENVMIEPQYIYSGYDENIISMVSANENLTTQYCGTGGNNWMDMTAVGSGTTFLEVGYEAVHVVDGYGAGEWGGAAGQANNFTFNAIDPNRTALIVVQTDGKAATDVSFGINCLSSNVEQSYEYNKAGEVPWDAEFDTVYFVEGDHGNITLEPTVKSGSIAKVEISKDKGASFNTLTADANGVYSADIYAGNNIIRVTKDDGTTAYQIVRGDKITYDITLVEDVDGDREIDPGDTVRVTLNGLHNPIGKMSGIYNPGFSTGIRVTYTWNSQTAQQSGYYQYDFVTNAWIEVQVPSDANGEYVLTEGYIAFNVFGDIPGNHRNLQDYGREINTTAKTYNYTRCLLPDIIIYEGEKLGNGDINGDSDIDSIDANMALAAYYGYVDFTEEQLNAADVSGDGEIDSIDANKMLAYYYGYIESFE